MWIKRNSWAIGGLRELGFKPDTDYLMVLSSQGRGLFDCLKNEKIARDPYDYYNMEWNSETGKVKGIGIFEGEEIICGGFEFPNVFPSSTTDGWVISIKTELRLNWKNEELPAEVLYLRNDLSNQNQELAFFHYGLDRGYGFSDTGRSFVIGTSSDLCVFTRRVEWDYISGWETSGVITPFLLEKWAHAENGYFLEQDEDLLFYRPELIPTMHRLMLDEKSKRKLDLLKILMAYSTKVYRSQNDQLALSEFVNLKVLPLKNDYHVQLVEHLFRVSN